MLTQTQMQNKYLIGNDVIMYAEVRLPDGTLYDPTTLVLGIKDTTGVVTSINKASLTRTSTGLYQYIYHPTVKGNYSYKYVAGGSYNGAAETYFTVTGTQVPIP